MNMPIQNQASPTDQHTSLITHNVIVCVHNGYSDVVQCLQSLAHTWEAEGLGNLILVDDYSDDETADYLNEFAKDHDYATLIRLDEQHFYTRAANIGLKFSTATLNTLLNSDTIVTPSWAQKIRSLFERDPNIGIVGPLSNAASTQSIPHVKSAAGQTAINHLPDGMSVERFADAISHLASGLIVPYVPVIHGFCYTIHRKVIDKIGYLDEENFPTGYGEENDYSFRADDAGFALGVALNSFVYHAKSKSYKPEQQQEFTRAGHDALARKHSAWRIESVIKQMENQPSLKTIRERVADFWPEHDWLKPPELNHETLEDHINSEPARLGRAW